MMHKHDLPVAREETERVDTLRYSWQKLQVQASQVSSHLIHIQPGFKSELIDNVKIFLTETNDFYGDYRVVRYHFFLCCLENIIENASIVTVLS